MTDGLRQRLTTALRDAVRKTYEVELDDIVAERPPSPSLGDLAFPVAFELARKARTAPRKIAEALEPALASVPGVSRVEVAGAGYLNVFVDRFAYIEETLARWSAAGDGEGGVAGEKVIVEHTNINPNKAAHIGHLRNAALGDSFVRALRKTGLEVEVQNYIDDTGVQVADVVVGFIHLEKQTEDDVRALIAGEQFDYHCWDLYARVSEFFGEDRERIRLREQTLKAIEEGDAPEAPMGALIAEAIVRCHLATMARIDVRYDLLPSESDILKMRFWQRAFELLKEKEAIRLSTKGKNEGCWVMDLGEEEPAEAADDATTEDRAEGSDEAKTEDDASDEKVIVRSNGTVTYVGKDIAYQMWKLGLLDRQFGFIPFHRYDDGHIVWATTAEPSAGATSGEPVPAFGNGSRVYNVIDARQAYLQHIVQRGVSLLATEEARERSRHFSYEMVALTPATCRELGFEVAPEDQNKPYLEVSGRKGLGVKADDLLDALIEKARAEVDERNPGLGPEERSGIADAIARGALRYFLVKYTKNKVIAFDFAEALAFEGDSGPYAQYAAVRAAKILGRLGVSPGAPIELPEEARRGFASLPLEESDDLWSLILSALDLDETVRGVIRNEEPAHLTRFVLTLAQRFNAVYHRYRVIEEQDPVKRALRALAVRVFHHQQKEALSLMGIPVPEQM